MRRPSAYGRGGGSPTPASSVALMCDDCTEIFVRGDFENGICGRPFASMRCPAVP